MKQKLLLIVLVIALGIPSLAYDTQAQTTQSETLAVLPFENTSQDPSMAWLANGISETLSTRLALLSQIRTVERSQVERLIKEIAFSQSAYVDETQSMEVGKLMSASYLVVGSYQVQGTQLLLQARLIEVESGEIRASAVAQGSRDQALNLQVQLATALSRHMRAESALPQQIGSEPSTLVFPLYQTRERAHALVQELPRHDLDPLRQRNQAKYFQALNYLETVLSSDSHDIESLIYTGLVYLNLEQKDKARDYLQKAVEFAPENPEANYTLGLYYKIQRDYQSAMKYLQIALENDPHHGDAAYVAGTILHLLKQEEQALHHLFIALSYRPYLQGAESLLRTILNSQTDSQSNADDLLSRAKHSDTYAAAVVWSALEKKQAEQAASFITSALRAYPDLYRFYYQLALVAQQKQQTDLALKLLKQSMSLHPTYAPGHLALGDLYFAKQDCQAARRHYRFYLHLANQGERFAEISQRIKECSQ